MKGKYDKMDKMSSQTKKIEKNLWKKRETRRNENEKLKLYFIKLKMHAEIYFFDGIIETKYSFSYCYFYFWLNFNKE